jgi:starvation-inducible DNA-binding protein
MTTMTERPVPASAGVIDGLQRELGNAFTLYGNYKRYHWQVSGPHFRDLHLLFDELGAAAADSIDPIGERIRILGGDPVATAAEVGACTTLEPARLGVDPRTMLEQALENETRTADGLREIARQAEDSGDIGTNSLLAPVVEVHEKHTWFLREALKRDDQR